jgi:hypothetical protein
MVSFGFLLCKSKLQRQSTEPNTNAAVVGPAMHMSNKSNLLLEGDRHPSHGNGLADIENMINQRHFTRQVFLHLLSFDRDVILPLF